VVNYIDNLYEININKIREEICNNWIYLIIDDTTDSKGRYVFNVMVGKLDGSHIKSRLLSVQFLNKVNHSTKLQAINNACAKLWPKQIKNENVILIV
jgi:hypothetical protein